MCATLVVKLLIVISIVFSSFNNVHMCHSILADCWMRWCWGWGTMAAVGEQQPPWSAGASGVRQVIPQPTNNQPPIHPLSLYHWMVA